MGCAKVADKIPDSDFVSHIHSGMDLFDCNVDDFWIGVRDSGMNFSITQNVRNNT